MENGNTQKAYHDEVEIRQTHRLRSMVGNDGNPSPLLSSTLLLYTLFYTLYSGTRPLPLFPILFHTPFSVGSSPAVPGIGNKGHLFAFLAKTEKGRQQAGEGRGGMEGSDGTKEREIFSVST